RTPFAEPAFANVPKNRSLYLSGRDIGDEYRYILERKLAKKFPGVMFKRPELLLNPWELQKTETGEKTAQAGEEYGALRQSEATALGRSAAPAKPKSGEMFSDYTSLDFLAESSAALLDLKPGANGVVVLERKALGNHPNLLVFAADPENSVYRQVMLQTPSKDEDAASFAAAAPASGPIRFPHVLDLRLSVGLEPDKHFTERKLIDVVAKGDAFILSNVTTAKCEVYDNLERAYRLYATLSGDATLQEFRFILDWPTFKLEEKREKYEKYASHELHFFLYKKDPAFFKVSVLPFLRNKKDKTFLDWWLIAAIDGNSKAPELSEWLKPWRHAQLNVVEKILLAQRLAADREGAARLVNEQFRLLPPDIDRYNHLFLTALQGRSLEMAAGGGAGGSAISLGGRVERQLAFSTDGASLMAMDKLGVETAAAAPHPAGMAMPASAPAPAKSVAFAGKPSEAAQDYKKTPARRAGIQTSEKLAELKEEAKTDLAVEMEGLKRDEGGLATRLRVSNAESRKELGELRYSYADGANKALDARAKLQRLYRALEGTKEFAENNYYHIPIAQQIAGRVTVNAFWNDYAAYDGKSPFVSKNLAEASHNFTEMMFALSVLDLPFQAKKLESKTGEGSLTIQPGNEAVIFHKEIGEAKPQAEGASLLVSQNFFRLSDRYREENGERFDKFVTQEFLTNVVYGCQVVLTNPTSTRYKVDVLLEIPRGAIPVKNSQYTRSVHLDLQPYNTSTLEYHFYFPGSGKFMHYPVHVARNETLMAFVQPFNFNVVEQPSQVDKASWDYISQFGTDKDVLEYLGRESVQRTRLERIAWRMKDASFFRKTLDLLQKVHAFDATLWSYGIKHNDVPSIREYLQFRDDFVQQCGAYIDSPLLTRDPVLRKTYQHLEYSPLVNPRIHQLGRKRDILNDRLFGQYHQLMDILSCRPTLDQDDLLTVTYYLLLQDRVEEAQKFFDRVKPSKIQTALQYDYFKIYFAFCAEDFKSARSLASKYGDYPAERWRKLFAAVVAQLDEIEKGAKAGAVDKMDQTEEQTRLAAAEPTLEFKIEAQKIQIQYLNVKECEVRYYPMDIELLFSRQPFVQEFSGLFSSIRPNSAETIKLDPEQKTRTVDLPAKYQSSNVMVEIVAGALRKSQACYANSLNVQISENYAQLKVAHAKTGKALSKVYIKVYARMQGGEVRFYKDGYTDPRGRFDYASLNTNELDRVERFSILILSESDGALVKEAGLPKR
ncbi:MAG: hypothetical protein NTX50_24975, partial [Candidatus Sumerlaeota bacterium]|nr:hypothetical protein [Candidatus Sumerlaeota bacterium]